MLAVPLLFWLTLLFVICEFLGFQIGTTAVLKIAKLSCGSGNRMFVYIPLKNRSEGR
jgi:hypothetical protein